MDRDPFPRTQWRSQSKNLGHRFVNLDSARRFPCGFLGFLLRSRVGSCFRLPTQVFDALALAPAVGSLLDSPPGGRAKTGTIEIRMSPSKLGMGEMKLSKTYIQTNKI
jgi:hypothetical protein